MIADWGLWFDAAKAVCFPSSFGFGCLFFHCGTEALRDYGEWPKTFHVHGVATQCTIPTHKVAPGRSDQDSKSLKIEKS